MKEQDTITLTFEQLKWIFRTAYDEGFMDGAECEKNAYWPGPSDKEIMNVVSDVIRATNINIG